MENKNMTPKKLFTIVDKKDNIIDYKEFKSIKSKDIYRVSALWITNNKRNILLTKRSLSKSHDPGKWEPAVAGTLEKNETYYSNIIKEAEEELGLRNIKPILGPKKRICGKYNFFVQWYFLTIEKPADTFKINNDEIVEIKWFTRKEIINMMHKNPNKFVKTMNKWIKIFC